MCWENSGRFRQLHWYTEHLLEEHRGFLCIQHISGGMFLLSQAWGHAFKICCIQDEILPWILLWIFKGTLVHWACKFINLSFTHKVVWPISNLRWTFTFSVVNSVEHLSMSLGLIILPSNQFKPSIILPSNYRIPLGKILGKIEKECTKLPWWYCCLLLSLVGSPPCQDQSARAGEGH